MIATEWKGRLLRVTVNPYGKILFTSYDRVEVNPFHYDRSLQQGEPRQRVTKT